MGEYAVTAPAETLMRKDRTGASNDIAMLCGARLVLANETRSDQRFDDLTIKTLVSTEPISARFLHQEFFTYMPTFKIWIRGNHKPVIVDESEGAWRRIRLIPFENQVHPDNVDHDLERKLLSEKEGILAWMVEGCLLWQKEGLKPSKVISDHSNLYRSECDILGEFLTERCITGKTERATQKDIWGEWQSWAREYNYYSGTKKTLTRKLSDRGITNNGYIGKERAYIGLRKKETSSNFTV
jgi:putative DNA primase/helicase